MTFVPQSRLLPRALWRPAMFFFAVAQIFLSFAPLLEGAKGPDARAHVEDTGTTLHHAHNDADCAACIARGLLSSSELESGRDDAVVASAAAKPEEAFFSLTSAWTTLARTRAPPSLTI
jgi:hypothetical protein